MLARVPEPGSAAAAFADDAAKIRVGQNVDPRGRRWRRRCCTNDVVAARSIDTAIAIIEFKWRFHDGVGVRLGACFQSSHGNEVRQVLIDFIASRAQIKTVLCTSVDVNERGGIECGAFCR